MRDAQMNSCEGISWLSGYTLACNQITNQLLLPFVLFFFTASLANAQMDTLVYQDFSSASGTTPPTGWTNVNTTGHAGDVWHFDNPTGRAINAPVNGTFAIFDSDGYSNDGFSENVSLVSPSFDVSTYAAVRLYFAHFFQGGAGGAYTVEVHNGTSWTSVLSGTASTTNAAFEDIDITSAAGSGTAQVRFRWTGSYSWYWAFDAVRIMGSPDTDGDGVADIDDLDDDNDGLPDLYEAGVYCTQTIILSGDGAGNIYRANLAAGTATLATTSTHVTGVINSLAANGDNQIAYYGNGTSVYIWDPVADTHTLMADLTGQLSGTFESGGGTYWKNNLYYATENVSGDHVNIYRIPLAEDGRSITGAPVALNPPTVSGGYGDIIITPEGSQGTIYGSTTDNQMWRFDIGSGGFSILNSGTTVYQQAVDFSGQTWAARNTTLQRININTGVVFGSTITFPATTTDMTGPFNCPQPDFTADTDGDGRPNHLDLDADGDGIPDLVEAGGIDTNGDGMVDVTTDIDGDGLADIYDNNDTDGPTGTGANTTDPSTSAIVDTNSDGDSDITDNDGDGLPDQLDLDADNDGIPDLVEAGGIDSNGDGRPDNSTDTDNDGLVDLYDTDNNDTGGAGDGGTALVQTEADSNSDGILNNSEDMTDGSGNSVDSDGDGNPDHLDLDADNDGIPDIVEAGGVDSNGDGRTDSSVDVDDDGLVDYYDTDNNNTAGTGDGGTALVRTEADSNSDGLLNGSEDMTDGSGNSVDSDDDGNPDHLDLDADNDGIPDIVEAGGVDSNGDGRTDSSADVDGDGLVDHYDTDNNNTAGTGDGGTALVQTEADSNSDGILNGSEDMTDGSGNSVDSDGDGNPDHLDLDADNDGLPDIVEAGGVDSNGDGRTDSSADIDGDGLVDHYDTDDNTTGGAGDGGTALVQTETDSNNDGILNGSEDMTDGSGASVDSDSDGNPDHLDLDADNDGIPDIVEAGGIDTNGDGRTDSSADVDGDGLVDHYDTDDNTTGGAGDGGTALVQTETDSNNDGILNGSEDMTDGSGGSIDHDGDGYSDHLDLDADNDGIPDIIEAGGASPGNDGMVNTGALPWDADGDGLADGYDQNASDGPGGSGVNGTALVETTADGNGDGLANGSGEGMQAGGGGSNNINADGDTQPNHLDLDADNDGITDVVENASGNIAADGAAGALDGIVNNYTDSADDNGWNDASTSATTDTDTDNIPDYLDIDADNDGIPDFLEGVCSTCPTEAAPTGGDSDGDGVLDIYENMSNDNSDNTTGTNTGSTPHEDDDDGSLPADYLDTDADNDGAYDWNEGFDSNNNGNAADDLIIMAANYETANTNPGDYTTADADSDGLPDWLDNIPLTAGYNENVVPPFLDPANTSYWVDANNNGLADIFDAAMGGTLSPTPDNNTDNDPDWRDFTAQIVLPVDLISFNGFADGCIVHLSWVTEGEENFSHFILERSNDAITFKVMNQTAALGGDGSNVYKYEDDQQVQAKSYYRLKMVDSDGTFSYSSVIFVANNCLEARETFQVYPNLIKSDVSSITVNLKSYSSEVTLVVSDQMGKLVRRMPLGVAEGWNVLRLDVSDLSPGIYFIAIEGMRAKVQKFIKIRD